MAPTVIEIASLADLAREQFSPIIRGMCAPGARHRQGGPSRSTPRAGLTLGVHSRIDECIERDAEARPCGNMYVNRNMIGAVVGVSPSAAGSSAPARPAGPFLHRLLRRQVPCSIRRWPIRRPSRRCSTGRQGARHSGNDERRLLTAPTPIRRDAFPVAESSICPGRPARTNSLVVPCAGWPRLASNQVARVHQLLAFALASGNRIVFAPMPAPSLLGLFAQTRHLGVGGG